MAKSKRVNGEGSVYKRNGKWVATFTAGRKPDGTFDRRYFQRSTQKEAIAVRDEAKRQHFAQQFVTQKGLTVEEAIMVWLDKVASERSPETLDNYSDYCNLHIIPHLGKLEVANVAPRDIEAFLQNRRQARTRRGAAYSATTIHHLYAVLRTAFREFERWSFVASNPVIKVPAPRTEKQSINTWSEREVRTFLEGAASDRHGPMFIFAVMTGLRGGEICGLRWEDIDFESGVVSVERTLQKGRDGEWRFLPTKTKRPRQVAFLTDGRLSQVLSLHRERQRELRTLGPAADKRFTTKWLDQGLVFTTSTGNPFPVKDLSIRLKNLLVRLGLPLVTPHQLRHTYASISLRNGVSLFETSRLLGHSTVSITADIYGHMTDQARRNAAWKFEQAIAAPDITEPKAREKRLPVAAPLLYDDITRGEREVATEPS